MSDFVLALVAATSVYLASVAAVAGMRRKQRARLLSRLGGFRSDESAERQPWLAKLAVTVARSGLGGRLARHAAKTDPTLRFSDYLAWMLIGVIAGAMTGAAFFGIPVLVVAAGASGPIAADQVLGKLSIRRRGRLEQQLPEALKLQSSAVRAGQSLVSSLRTLASEIPAPLGDEISDAIREIDLGRPLESVLQGIQSRAPSREVEFWITAMLVHRQTGGNLATTLESLSERVGNWAQLRAELRALTAQGRLSGVIVALAPLGFFLLLSTTSREQVQVLYSTPVGLLVLVVGLSMQAIGFLWIRQILRIRA